MFCLAIQYDLPITNILVKYLNDHQNGSTIMVFFH